MDCYNDKHKMPTMDSITERLTWYAENYGRTESALQEAARRADIVERKHRELEEQLDRERKSRRYWESEYTSRGVEIEKLNDKIVKLEKKLPKKPAKKVAMRVKR